MAMVLVAIALGEAFKAAIGDRNTIERYSSVESLVMDETISIVTIDMASRTLLKMKTSDLREYVGDFPTEMFEHFFISFINTFDHLTIFYIETWNYSFS